MCNPVHCNYGRVLKALAKISYSLVAILHFGGFDLDLFLFHQISINQNNRDASRWVINGYQPVEVRVLIAELHYVG